MTLIAGSYEKFIWGFSLKTQKNKSASEENPNLNTKTIALNSLFSYPSHTAPIKTLAVSGPVAVSGGGDECIKIYDLVTSSEIGSVLTTATTTSLAFYSPSDLSFPRNLVAGTDSGTVEIYDADPFVHLKSVKVHKRAVADVAVHRSGRLALSVGRDGRLAMVNLLNGRRTFCSRLDKEAGLVKYGLGGSAGKDMFFMGVEQKVYVHDSEDARILMEFEARSKVLCIAPGEVVF